MTNLYRVNEAAHNMITVGALGLLQDFEVLVEVEPDSEAIIDILVAMLDEYDYRGRNLDFGEYAGRIAATWKDTE